MNAMLKWVQRNVNILFNAAACSVFFVCSYVFYTMVMGITNSLILLIPVVTPDALFVGCMMILMGVMACLIYTISVTGHYLGECAILCLEQSQNHRKPRKK